MTLDSQGVFLLHGARPAGGPSFPESSLEVMPVKVSLKPSREAISPWNHFSATLSSMRTWLWICRLLLLVIPGTCKSPDVILSGSLSPIKDASFVHFYFWRWQVARYEYLLHCRIQLSPVFQYSSNFILARVRSGLPVCVKRFDDPSFWQHVDWQDCSVEARPYRVCLWLFHNKSIGKHGYYTVRINSQDLAHIFLGVLKTLRWFSMLALSVSDPRLTFVTSHRSFQLLDVRVSTCRPIAPNSAKLMVDVGKIGIVTDWGVEWGFDEFICVEFCKYILCKARFWSCQ